MTSGRALLAQQLRDALPAWQIVSDTRQLDGVRRPGAILLWTQSRRKAPALGLDWFTDEVTLQVLTAADKPDRIEDDLDELLFQVMAALEPLDAFAWDLAERVAVADTWHGWQLTITCIYQLTTDPDPEPEEN